MWAKRTSRAFHRAESCRQSCGSAGALVVTPLHASHRCCHPPQTSWSPCEGGAVRWIQDGSRSRARWQESASPLLIWQSFSASGTASDDLGAGAHATATRCLRLAGCGGFSSATADAGWDPPRPFRWTGLRRRIDTKAQAFPGSTAADLNAHYDYAEVHVDPLCEVLPPPSEWQTVANYATHPERQGTRMRRASAVSARSTPNPDESLVRAQLSGIRGGSDSGETRGGEEGYKYSASLGPCAGRPG